MTLSVIADRLRAFRPRAHTALRSDTSAPPDRLLPRKALLNTSAALLDYVAWLLVGLIVNPILVSALGSTLYGMWKVLGQTVEYLSYADARGPQALKWLVAKNRETATCEELRRHVGAAFQAMAVLSPLLLLFGALLVWLSPIITNAEPQMRSAVMLASATLGLGYCFGLLSGFPEAVLRGMNLGYKRMGVQALLTCLGGALLAYAACRGYGLVGIAVAQSISAVMTGCLFWLICLRAVPWFGAAWVPFRSALTFLRLSGSFLSWSVVDKLLRSSDLVLLGVFADNTLVTTYVLTRYAAETAGKVIRTAVFGVLPGLGGIIGRGEHAKAAFLRSQMMATTWLMATALGCAVLACNRSFLTLWIGPQHFAGQWANALIVVLFVQIAMLHNDVAVMSIALRPGTLARSGGAAAVLSTLLSLLLVPAYGIVGLCFALLTGRLVICIAYPRAVRQLFEASPGWTSRAVVRAGAVGVALLSLSTYLGTLLSLQSWWCMCATALVCFTTAAVLMFTLGFDESTRSTLLMYARRACSRPSA